MYTIIFEKEADGGYHVYCPALKGCHSQGDTYDEALENIEDAIKLFLSVNGRICKTASGGSEKSEIKHREKKADRILVDSDII